MVRMPPQREPSPNAAELSGIGALVYTKERVVVV
jgi:hypothetical protein